MRHAFFFLGWIITASQVQAQGTKADYERSEKVRAELSSKMILDRVEPHWSKDGNLFWFERNLGQGKSAIARVDAVQGTVSTIDAATRDKEFGKADPTPGRTAPPPRTRRENRGRPASPESPDGKWTALVKDHDVYLKEKESKTEQRLTTDGVPNHGYNGEFYWSPDSTHLIAIRFKPGGDRKVTLVESSPKDRLQPKTSHYDYLKPGDPIPQRFPRLFDVAAKKEVGLDNKSFDNPWEISHLAWDADSSRFTFVYNQRGHRVMRWIALDAKTGQVKVVINEEPKTFFDYANKLWLEREPSGKSVLWMSERSGFNQIHRLDSQTGTEINRVSKAGLVVRGVERYDPEKGELVLRVLGKNPNEDPYHVHYARVKIDGTGWTDLTEADGTHRVRFSPEGRFYLDTYSRADLPPVTELRKSDDGKLILAVEKADVGPLEKAGWMAPERFVAKGRDGKTDIHGLIFRPRGFDAKKKYPVIENIYAGPHDHHVPKAFNPVPYEQPMAELGFIVVKIDGMGTNWRSKEFHDVCWKNLGDSGFPDRIAWIKAAAAKHAEMDLSKGVGIYGGSAGGQSAMRAMTEHGDFYTVAVADCGCHDNRMDKIWWNELWMSWPIEDHYKNQSNVTNANKIQGKLMLVVGELDRNVDPASTLQVVNALIKANKDFDMLLVPGGGHGIAESPYGNRRRKDYFVRHLMGVEPRK